MNAKKIITLLLALVLAAGTVACGAKQAERNEDTDKEPQTAEEAAALYDELMAQENAIQAENTELWEKLFPPTRAWPRWRTAKTTASFC